MTTEGKRRAVFTVLSEFVQGDDLWRAMWRWQHNYADKSQFELNAFLSDCRDIAEIAANRSTLYRQLIGLLMDKKADLKPDPMIDMMRFRSESAGHDTPAGQNMAEEGDWSESFSVVLRALFAQLRSDTARLVKHYATEQATRNKLPKELTYEFTLWDQGKLLCVNGVPLPDLRRLLNFIYIGLCESLGPVEADLVLSAAIREAQDTLADISSGAPDPRQLLHKF